jgi:FkbM family methyltransferase
MIRKVVVSCVKVVRPNPREDVKRLVRRLASRNSTRWILNRYYSRLTYAQRSNFHEQFSGLFDGYAGRFDDGAWELVFRGRRIRLPLRKEIAALDWDLAVAVLGHDVEVKQSYEALLGLNVPPKVVLDVGTNFGTHSILFLASRIKTVSFEPNPNCHPYLKEASAMNQVECEIEPVALGDEEGQLELCFPQGKEWNGTVVDSVKENLGTEDVILKIDVRMTTMDNYVQHHSLKPDLIKLDTEGAELAVLRGGRHTLLTFHPPVIFEAWPGSEERTDYYSAFADLGYQICGLPLCMDTSPVVFDLVAFQNSRLTNFIAITEDMVKAWPPQFSA